MLLIVLCVVFAVLTALVMRKTDGMQSAVERITATSPSAPPTRSATSRWCRASSRIEAEVQGLRYVVDKLLARADAGAVVVGAGRRAHPRLDHDHGAGDLHRRHLRCTSRA